jgi:hypothetical protein
VGAEHYAGTWLLSNQGVNAAGPGTGLGAYWTGTHHAGGPLQDWLAALEFSTLPEWQLKAVMTVLTNITTNIPGRNWTTTDISTTISPVTTAMGDATIYPNAPGGFIEILQGGARDEFTLGQFAAYSPEEPGALIPAFLYRFQPRQGDGPLVPTVTLAPRSVGGEVGATPPTVTYDQSWFDPFEE